MFRQEKSLTSITFLFALTTAVSSSAVSLIADPVLAQSSGVNNSFPVPKSVPKGTQVRINGTSSMENINQALARQFKEKYPGTDIKTAYDGTDTSLKALPDGKIDIAAVGRSLTATEKAQGLVSTPITRNKIAVIVSKNNPNKKSLTSDQFAKIFRGEITNWSQVGGSPQAIRLIDRPENSDLRQAFQNYPVFQTAPFRTGANVVKSQDNTDALIKELGTDGIGYAIADQVVNNPNVQIIPLHNVQPTDPRYPFSQPLGYAHKGANSSAAAKAFLGYATAPENRGIIEQARVAGTSAIAAPVATTSPQTTPTTTARTESREGFPWWWLLLIPILGGILWWLLSRRPSATPVAPPAAIPANIPESRIVLTPRTCKDAYVYWEIPDEAKQDLQRQGARQLKLRLYDVTDIDMEHQKPHSMKEFDCNEQVQDMHIPITTDNRDYIAEIGYINNIGRWLKVARSTHVRVPACEPSGDIPTTAAGVAASGVAADYLAGDRTRTIPKDTKHENRLILVPRNARDAYAYWEVSPEQKAQLRQQGGRKLALRIYDTTNIDLERQSAHSFQQFDCDESKPDLHIPIAQSDREYVAELGYITDDGRWLQLARSASIRVPSTPPTDNAPRHFNSGVFEQVDNISKVSDVTNKFGGTIAGGTAAVAGMGTAARSFLNRENRPDINQPAMKSDCRIILVPRNSEDAYAYWEVSDDYKAAARRQGGRRFMLRVHDVTNLDIDNQLPHSTQEYLCDEHEQDKHIAIPQGDRDYIAEVGYYTDDNRWLSIIRSFYVHVPSSTLV